jgi:hypothetical protein
MHAYNLAVHFPPVDELVAQCAKFKLMERLLVQLRDRGHKVLLHLVLHFFDDGFMFLLSSFITVLLQYTTILSSI